MFKKTLFDGVKSLRRSGSKNAARKRPRARVGVEPLENRSLLSVTVGLPGLPAGVHETINVGEVQRRVESTGQVNAAGLALAEGFNAPGSAPQGFVAYPSDKVDAIVLDGLLSVVTVPDGNGFKILVDLHSDLGGNAGYNDIRDFVGPGISGDQTPQPDLHDLRAVQVIVKADGMVAFCFYLDTNTTPKEGRHAADIIVTDPTTPPVVTPPVTPPTTPPPTPPPTPPTTTVIDVYVNVDVDNTQTVIVTAPIAPVVTPPVVITPPQYKDKARQLIKELEFTKNKKKWLKNDPQWKGKRGTEAYQTMWAQFTARHTAAKSEFLQLMQQPGASSILKQQNKEARRYF